jgi:hypothetical protein
MRTGLSVDALFGQAKALNGATGDEVLLHDGFSVFGLHVAVPNGLRVDHNRGTVLALVETQRFVDAYGGSEAGLFGQLRKAGVQIAFAIGRTGRAWGSGGADVMTDEDVTFKGGQRESSRSECEKTFPFQNTLAGRV